MTTTNPDAHETIAKQWDAEAVDLEARAKHCRLEAAHSRMMVSYIKFLAQVAKP